MQTEFGTYQTRLSVNENGVRVESFDGDPYVVAPVVAVQESVLKGMYLPEDEIRAATPAFNGAPLPVGHPVEGGEFVSANTPERREAQSVGFFFNVDTDDAEGVRMVGETWVNARKSATLAERDPVMGAPLAVLSGYLDDPGSAGEFITDLPSESHEVTAHNANDGGESGMLEVSTAYWFDPDETPGTFNGNSYAAVQRHVRPDHLALLPHKEGECSVADGCGAPRANSEFEYADGTSTATASADDAEAVDSSMNTTFSAAASAIGRFAHNCVCGCGGSCYDDTMQPQELADLTGISLEVLEAMDESDRKSLADLASQQEDDDGDDGGGQHDDGSTDNDNDNDEGAAPEANELRDELAAVREELAEVRESVTAQERAEKEALVDDIAPHSSLDRDSLQDLDKDVLEGMHADLTPASADMGGRVRGVPAGNTSGEDDERVEEAESLAAQLSGRADLNGSGAEGDD